MALSLPSATDGSDRGEVSSILGSGGFVRYASRFRSKSGPSRPQPEKGESSTPNKGIKRPEEVKTQGRLGRFKTGRIAGLFKRLEVSMTGVSEQFRVGLLSNQRIVIKPRKRDLTRPPIEA